MGSQKSGGVKAPYRQKSGCFLGGGHSASIQQITISLHQKNGHFRMEKERKMEMSSFGPWLLFRS